MCRGQDSHSNIQTRAQIIHLTKNHIQGTCDRALERAQGQWTYVYVLLGRGLVDLNKKAFVALRMGYKYTQKQCEWNNPHL